MADLDQAAVEAYLAEVDYANALDEAALLDDGGEAYAELLVNPPTSFEDVLAELGL